MSPYIHIHLVITFFWSIKSKLHTSTSSYSCVILVFVRTPQYKFDTFICNNIPISCFILIQRNNLFKFHTSISLHLCCRYSYESKSLAQSSLSPRPQFNDFNDTKKKMEFFYLYICINLLMYFYIFNIYVSQKNILSKNIPSHSARSISRPPQWLTAAVGEKTAQRGLTLLLPSFILYLFQAVLNKDKDNDKDNDEDNST